MAERGPVFIPSAFYEGLSSSINEQIDIQIEDFKKELLAVSVSSSPRLHMNIWFYIDRRN